MIEMVEKEFIRKRHFRDGWSIRKISRQLGISRPTILKCLVDAEPPRYQIFQPRPCPIMDPFREIILAWLKEDDQAPPKQRHTARRIYHRLRDEYDFQGSEATVRRYVARLRPKAPEVMLPLSVAWGEQAQVDWGQAHVRIAGEEQVVHLFCLKMRASGVSFAWAAPTEKLEAFLEGHRRAFEWLGGVPATCLYDNLKTAVVHILAGPEREEHKVFSSLRAHYLFDSVFCRPAQPHEKGAVENLVGYVRRNALVPVPDFPSWAVLEDHLLAWCEKEKQHLQDGWGKEWPALRPLPATPFRCAKARFAGVNRLSLVHFDRNRYTVPCEYVGRTLQLLAYTDRVELLDGKQVVAVHERHYGRGEMGWKLEHYLSALARKPRAATHLALVPKMPPIYAEVRDRLLRASRDGYREFCAMLLLHGDFPAQAVTKALGDAAAQGLLTANAVRQILLNQATSLPIPVRVPEPLAQAQIQPADPGRYDHFLAREGGVPR